MQSKSSIMSTAATSSGPASRDAAATLREQVATALTARKNGATEAEIARLAKTLQRLQGSAESAMAPSLHRFAAVNLPRAPRAPAATAGSFAEMLEALSTADPASTARSEAITGIGTPIGTAGTIAGLQQALAEGRQSAADMRAGQRARLAEIDATCRAAVEPLGDEVVPAASGGPLAGVGLAHKDIFDLPDRAPGLGRGTTQAAPGRVAATVIQRLSQAGAGHLATLSMAEFACGATGDNPHLARCINPLHDDAMVGGSSSGSAVAVASGMACASLGTDTAGSVRMPAASCGVLGLKTTHGLLPLDGVFPLAPSLDSVGVLARCTDDLQQVLEVVADSGRLRPAAGERAAIWMPDTGIDPAVTAALQAFSAVFGLPVKTRIDSHAELTHLAEIVLHTEAARTHHAALLDGSLSPAVEAVALPGLVMPPAWHAAALADRARRLQEFVAAHLQDVDVLVIPALPAPIPDARTVTPGQPGFDVRQLLALHRFMGFINYLGLPSLAVPVARDARGLPISVQLVGRPFHELTLLRFAAQIETRHFRMTEGRTSAPTALRPIFSPEDRP